MVEDDEPRRPACRSCDAGWWAGEFDPDCGECGSGALDVTCRLCGGRCGRRWRRAVVDSNDSHQAHFIGGCGLEQRGGAP